MDRRRFLRNQGMGAAALLTASVLDRIDWNPSPIPLEDGMTVLFQGDSITDAGRNRGRYYANEASGMGHGYVHLTAAELLGTNAEKNLKIYNRGISGHKVYQLAGRWELDCLALKPDVLSILIGVNDFWHTLGGNYDGTAAVYEKDLRALLDRTLDHLPEVKLIIGIPFAVEGGTAINAKWGDFAAYRTACKQVGLDYNATIIPYQRIFDEALKEAPASFWCPDGVHPSMAGAFLMKESWMKAFGAL